jgi:hypothetical protein
MTGQVQPIEDTDLEQLQEAICDALVTPQEQS